MQDEELLDSFIAKAHDETTPDLPIAQSVQQTDEDVVESKARQGKQSASILQKRTTIPETELEKRIASTIRKYPDIAETKIREDLADQIGKNGGEDITEGQYASIANSHIKKSEQAKKQAKKDLEMPLIQPPAFASKTIQGIQDKVGQAADRASALSTPGGVGILIFVLMFFIWAIIPVSNGKTRLHLLWAVLTNQAYFPDDTNGTSGYFGPTGDGSIPDTNIVNNGAGSRSSTVTGPTLVPYVPNFEQDEW